MNCKERAKELRKEFKKAFPDFKFSITSDYNSINVHLMEGPLDFGDTYTTVNHFWVKEHYEGEQLQILSLIIDSVQKDQCTVVEDGDYGSVPNFYLNVRIGKWDRPYVVRESNKKPVTI